jgi:Golgi phosphoprotein 3 (GPP34)
MRLHAKLTGLGLAGALLGELMLGGRVTIEHVEGQARLVPVDTAPTGDALTQKALDHIVDEPWHPFRTWLHFCARTAHADVAARMTAAGLLRRVRVRRYAPVDANTAVVPVARLNLAMRHHEPLTTGDAVLVGLLVVTGVARLVLWDQRAQHPSVMAAAVPEPLKDLIAQTEAAVGDAVISLR